MENGNQQTRIPKRAILIVIIVVAIITLFIASIAASRGQGKGTVTVLSNLTDTSGVTVTYNDEKGKIKGQELSAGDYTVVVSKKGYDNYKKQFTMEAGDQLIVNAQLKPERTSTITSLADIGLGSTFNDGSIVSTQYFYDNTWAVVIIQYQDETDAAVLQYNTDTDQWQLILNPGIFYTSFEVGQLPALVQGYLQDNNFVGQED